MLQRTYERLIDMAGRRHATSVLAGVTFLESSVFPIPPDVMLVPMILADRGRAWTLALLCTIASVAGGIAGYAVGLLLFEAVGETILSFYGAMDDFVRLKDLYAAWGFWIVFAAGVTPIPYKVFTIASGAMALDPLIFVVGSAISRGLRFLAVSGLFWYLGPPARRFIDRNLRLVTAGIAVLVIGGFMLLGHGVPSP